MKRPLRFFQSVLAAALLLGSSLVAPWLEREPASRLSIESRHNATCVPLHDHGICIQLQHARALPEGLPEDLPSGITNPDQRPAPRAAGIAAISSAQALPRAPPQN